MRVVLPWHGGVAHLFVVYWYQGAESDADKLALTDQLITSVLCMTKVCCSFLVGYLNADPLLIPSLAKGISDGDWVDLEKAFATGRGVRIKAPARDFTLICPNALVASTSCRVLLDRWFYPHFCALH